MTALPTKMAETKTLLRLATPAALLQAGTAVMGMVDTFVVGQYSAKELAGIAAGHGIFWTLVMMGMGFLYSIDTLVSQAFGAKDERRCHATLGAGMICALVFSAMACVFIIFVLPFYHLTGADPEIVAVMVPFVKNILPSFPLFMMFFVLHRYWQALQIVVPVTVIILMTGVLNYFLDLYFVTGRWGGTPLGAVGAAHATVLSRAFCLALLIGTTLILWRRRQGRGYLSPWPALLQWRLYPWRAMLKLGVPASVQVLVEVGSFALVSVLVARLGAEALATHQIVLSIASLTFQLPLGLSMATAARVGMYWGAGQRGFAYITGWIGIGLAMMVMAVFAFVFAQWPQDVLGVFSHNASVLTVGISVLMICAVFQVFDGAQVVATAVARGFGNTTISLVVNIISFYILGLPVGLYLAFTRQQGLFGLWIGLGIGLIGTAVLMCSYLLRMHNREAAAVK